LTIIYLVINSYRELLSRNRTAYSQVILITLGRSKFHEEDKNEERRVEL